jgi:hypothetical protein
MVLHGSDADLPFSLLLQHINLLSSTNIPKTRHVEHEISKDLNAPQKGPPSHTVKLRALSLRINQPYWVLHHGNCEHWFAIDEIRSV